MSSKIRFDSSSPGDTAFLLKFPSGAPKPTAFVAGHEEEIPFQVYQSEDSRPSKALHRLIRGDSDRVEFVGQNFGDLNRLPLNASTFAIGIIKNGENSVKLIETPHIFHMKPRVKKLQPHRGESDLKESFMEESFSYGLVQSSLIEQFGSRKRKSQLKSKAANKVTMQEEIGFTLSETLEESKTRFRPEDFPMDDKEIVHSVKSLVLPPYDLNTEFPERVYPLENIISDRELDLLNGEAQQFLRFARNPGEIPPNTSEKEKREKIKKSRMEEGADEKPALNIYISEFVRHRIKYLLDLPTKEEQKKSAALLVFINYLIYFRQYRGGKSHARAFPNQYQLNEGIREKILQEFTEKRFRSAEDLQGKEIVDFVISSQLMRKLTVYLCILSLFSSPGFYLTPEDLQYLAEDYKLRLTELLEYYREIGCPGANKTMGAKLLAPLQLPKLKRIKRDKKK